MLQNIVDFPLLNNGSASAQFNYYHYAAITNPLAISCTEVCFFE